MSTTDNRYERVWRVVEAIPPGAVATYGQVADLAGMGRGARQVGYALRQAGDRKLPWHRVINAAGKISFPRGSSAYEKQRTRLEAEGVEFLGERVIMNRFQWQPSLDEILWRL